MNQCDATPRLLVTAGPTYEPIDAVRFIGNRSSGKVGVAIADRASALGWDVRLLLGPNAVQASNPLVETVPFQPAEELESLLQTNLAQADTLIMAAAVADYRVRKDQFDPSSKLRRGSRHQGMTLELESTPDLLYGCSEMSREDQLLVGFALEPAERLILSAQEKLRSKNIDLIVANPLETMDSDSIEATLLGNSDRGIVCQHSTPGVMTKDGFASWLIEQITPFAIQRMHR